MPSSKPSSPVYQSGNSLNTGTVLLWAMSEGSGTALADIGPNNIGGTITPGASGAWDNSDATYGPGYSFAGTGSVTANSNPASLHPTGNTTKFTVILRLKQTTFVGTAQAICGNTTNAFLKGWYCALTSGALALYCSNNGGGFPSVTLNVLTAGVYNWAVLTFDNTANSGVGQQAIYAPGNLSVTGSFSSGTYLDAATFGNFTVGKAFANVATANFAGVIDYVQYDTGVAWTQAQANAFFANAAQVIQLTAGTLTPAVNAIPTKIDLSWTAPAGPVGTVTYEVDQSPDNGSNAPTGSWSNLTSGGTGTTYSVTGLTAGTKVWFRVIATDSKSPTPQTATYTSVSVTPGQVSYSPSSLALDSAPAVDGGSNLRLDGSGNLVLNWNRPAVDANHIAYFRSDDGTGTAVTDASASAHNATLTAGVTGPPSWDGVPIMGNASLRFGSGKYVNCGTILQYERTQAWSVLFAFRATKCPTSGSSTGVLFTSAQPGNNYKCFELFTLADGQLRCRIIGDFILSKLIDVTFTGIVCDGAVHIGLLTYDGSSTAAGVKCYNNGSALSFGTANSDTLDRTIISGNPFIIGNQIGNDNPDFPWPGALGYFEVFNTIKDSTYASGHASTATLPVSASADTALRLTLQEGVGTTTADSSTNNATCTLSDVTMWMESAPAWKGASQILTGVNRGNFQATHISAYNIANPFVIEGEAYCNSFFQDNPLVGHTDTSGTNAGWSLHVGKAQHIKFYNGTSFIDSGVASPIGWHHFAVRYLGTNYEFFVDGSLVATVAGSAPSSVSQPLILAKDWSGPIGPIRVSNATRSNGYLAQFAPRFPSSGVATLSTPTASVNSGGGDFGSTVAITGFTASFSTPSTSAVQIRVGMGASSSAAITDAQALSFTTLNSSNTLSKSGRFVYYELKPAPSTDTLARYTPTLTSLTFNFSSPSVGGFQISQGIGLGIGLGL